MRRTTPFARLLLLAALGGVLSAGCEDLPAGPGGLDALATGAAPGTGLSLRDLFAAAMFRVQRDEGTDTALAVLQRWRAARDGAEGAPDVRSIEASTVLRAFGRDVVGQAADVVSREIREAELAASRVAATAPGMEPSDVRETLAAVERAVALARAGAGSTPDAALLLLDDAAAQLGRIRAVLVDAAGLPTLDALYRRALADGSDPLAAVARSRETALTAAVDSARQDGGVDRRYETQEALRSHKVAFVVQRLGADVGRDVLDGVAAELDRLRPALDSLDAAGRDVGRDRRMADAAAAIAERADAALRDGDPARALDLAAHAAGLVDELVRRIR